MIQYVIVFIILACSVLYAFRRIRRSLDGKSATGVSPLCAGCSGCALYKMDKCKGKKASDNCTAKEKNREETN